MSDVEQAAEPWEQLLSKILSEREKPTFRRVRAAVRRGSLPATEIAAYPYVVSVLKPGASAATRTALLRSMAIAAEYTDVPQWRQSPIGVWARRVEMQRTGKNAQDFLKDPGILGVRLANIHTLGLEEAAVAVRSVFAVAERLPNPPAVDYYDLTRTLIRWGNGITGASRWRRTKILRDFYSGVFEDSWARRGEDAETDAAANRERDASNFDTDDPAHTTDY